MLLQLLGMHWNGNSTLAQGGVYGRLGRAGQVCLHHALLLQSHSQQSHPW